MDKIGQGRHNWGCLSYYSGAIDEPDDVVFDVDDEDDQDDTYIDDGVVAPVDSAVQGQDDDFFI